jgi:hypothetical protein
MKVNILEAHDRLLSLNKQSDYISKGCQDCINSRPPEFGAYPFYIFAHGRTIEADEKIAVFNQDVHESIIRGTPRQFKSIEDVPNYRFIWAPRLSKPKAQTNSMLFKAYPGTDMIKVIWILPARELWGNFAKDKLTESKDVANSIHDFLNNREKMEAKEPDDLHDYQIDDIYTEISNNAAFRKAIKPNS